MGMRPDPEITNPERPLTMFPLVGSATDMMGKAAPGLIPASLIIAL